MKESEAKTKWCPMIRYATKSGGDWDKCIASDCMMWVEYTVTTSGLDGMIRDSWQEGRCGLTNV